jgi:hypothetical protein
VIRSYPRTASVYVSIFCLISLATTAQDSLGVSGAGDSRCHIHSRMRLAAVISASNINATEEKRQELSSGTS